MATLRGKSRLQVGSAPWIAEERDSAAQIAAAETEEFTFSARNEVEWLNEHMADVFSKNRVNVAEIFKTPGKLRGKTPRTARKINPFETRAPLSDVFSSTPRGELSPFRKIHFERPVATFQVAEDEPDNPTTSTSNLTKASPPEPTQNAFDSGYHGSQPDEPTQANEAPLPVSVPSPVHPREDDSIMLEAGEDDGENVEILGRDSEERRTTEGSFQSAKEEQTRNVQVEAAAIEKCEVIMASTEPEKSLYPVLESPIQSRKQQSPSPHKRSPERVTPAMQYAMNERTADEAANTATSTGRISPIKISEAHTEEVALVVEEDEVMDDAQSPSDGSSPIRAIVRKSSLNFASLPAREPITTKKSIGNRVSRTSHIDQPRTSYYGRTTGGKSLGNIQADEEDDDEMEVDQLEDAGIDQDDTNSPGIRLHSKTSTQRLQDQINMLGKTQSNMRPSKSLASTTTMVAQPIQTNDNPVAVPEIIQSRSPVLTQSPQRRERPPPGAFPEDEDESWIGPPPANGAPPSVFSPGPQMMKSHTADIMEDIHGKNTIAGSQFSIAKRGEQPINLSLVREPTIPERTNTIAHSKSVSTSVLRSPMKAGDSPGSKKGISVSNPTPFISTANDEASVTPPKSPARSHRGSPLKAAKDKFTSILKSSRGLFASSAAVSAEAKSSALSPPSSRVGLINAPSFEDILSQANDKNPVYPNLNAHAKGSQLSFRMPESPFKGSARKTRASTEREEKRRDEAKRREEEAKETKVAQKLEAQLEKARMKVREDAHRDFIAQERAVIMQKELAARNEDKNLASISQINVSRTTHTSPRKTKAQLEAEGIAAAAASTDELASKDVDMSDASYAMPPPAIPRPKSQIGRPGAKRPLKPAKEPITKAKPPTVIRVDTGSQRGHQYHPSTATLAATLQESLSASQASGPSQALRNKASTSSIQSKASTSSFKSAATKALEAAAKKKEQDDLAAQRKREAKQEIERQRAAIREEEKRKEELQRRQEAEKQRELQRERERLASQIDAKKTAQRQAIEKRRQEMEKAKETRAPPPALRPQPSGDLGHAMLHEKALPPLPPQQDMNPPRAIRMNTAVQRAQEEPGRPTNTMLSKTSKAPPKRPMQADSEDFHSRPTIQRSGPSYQSDQPSKRRRTSENFGDDDDRPENQPKMTAPPIRQSTVRQKELPPKSLFPNGYANIPPTGTSLQRTTLISQHNVNQAKNMHPMDMAQISKAPIPFASTSGQINSQHKTPARPGAPSGGGKSVKSAAKSSPRYQNGENIVLPEIHTDSEDENSDGGDFPVQGWTNSPDLRKALVMQETMNPAEIFGQPGPLNMEEVFSKSKDRWHKFRNRTSSANWSGSDRLTEDDVRKDLEGRDKVRRQGGWTYDSMV